MSKMKIWLLVLWITLFAVFLGCSILFESPVCLYVASALPILIVLWLPNPEQNQYIRRRHLKKVQLLTRNSGENGLLTITFTPGFVRWKRGAKLYFHLDTLSREEPVEAGEPGEESPHTSLSILPFDLLPHPRKSGWVGIDLDQVAARTSSLAIATSQVARFVVPLQALEQAAIQRMAGLMQVGGDKRLHA
ncbi:hypothetical protein WMW72_30100 [Paenibacillus filicis]|uniref:DUF58 domain-containing protein n=1 Tax=Paenibacillus filicis TaxID=669464 RepID=A0ABU9DTF7_9BACL